MVVRYKGATSSEKPLPGGGPQGTLLGLLLFIVLINDAGFAEQENNVGKNITARKNFKAEPLLHLKYVDDMTLAESINLTTTMPKLVTFCLKGGHKSSRNLKKLGIMLHKIK